jgi:hypothetical protein
MNNAVLNTARLGVARLNCAYVGTTDIGGVMGAYEGKKETFYILDTKGRRIVDINKVRMVYK